MPKVYNVSIYLDINTVSCPGVWLCPKGKAFLKICLFGVSDLTKEVDPFFPLVFKERFHFQKVFKNMNSVYELHDKLGRSIISLELLQCPIGSAGCVKLALFNALLSDILHPYTTCFSKPLHTSGLELLFTTCKVFPGIIAPKVDVSTKVMVTDSLDGRRNLKSERLRSRSVNDDDDKKRQHKVCHTKNNTNCRCFQSKGDQSNGAMIFRSADAAQSDESIQTHDVRESGRKKTGRSKVVEGDYDEKKNVYASNREKEIVQTKTARGDVDDPSKVSRISRERAISLIDSNNDRGIGRPTTVPKEDWSGGRNYSNNEGRTVQENIPSSRYTQEDTSRGRRGDLQEQTGKTSQPARPRETSDEKYGSNRITSCERLLRNYDYEEMRNMNDDHLKGRYFRCFKERRAQERPESLENRERGEVSKNHRQSNMMTEPGYERILDRTTKNNVDRGCTCLRSYNKKSKKSSSSARRHRQDSWENLTGAWYDKRETGTSVARSTIPGETGQDMSRVERELPAGEMPRRAEYRDDNRRDQPERTRSRSDVVVFNKQNQSKYGGRSVDDRKYNGDDERQYEAGEMLPSSEYRENYQYRTPGGQRYPEYRPTSVPETHGRGDRAYKYAGDTSGQYQPEPELRQIPTAARQNRQADDNRRDVIKTMSPDRDYRPRPERVSKPKNTSNNRVESTESSSEQSEHASEDECKCPLCKNYQDVYKPKIHPCPRFRKTTGMSSKIRHSKSNIGPKKLIPSRRSKVSKTVIESPRNMKSRPKDCGFANCETIDDEFIANKKDIKSFYKQA